jgi:hypothetical protein
LYEMITGRKKFQDDFAVHHYANSDEHKAGVTLNVDIEPGLKPLFVRWINDLLDVDPLKRPSAAENATALHLFIFYLGNNEPTASTTRDIMKVLDPENVLGTDLPTKSGMLEWDDVFSRNADQHEYTVQRYGRLRAARRAQLGPTHQITAWSLSCLAWTYYYRMYFRLEPWDTRFRRWYEFTELVEIKRSTLGEGHLETLSARLGLALEPSRSFGEASTLQDLNELLKDMQRELGPEHPETLSCKYFAAFGLANQNDLKCFEVFEDVVAVQQRVLGKEDCRTLRSISALGVARYTRGEYYEAYHLLKVSLDGCLGTLGPDHMQTIFSRYRLAQLYNKIGKKELAVTNLAEANKWGRKIFGDKHVFGIPSLPIA